MESFISKPFTLDRTIRVALFILCVIALSIAISAIWEVLLPFLLAGIFAYLLMPLVRFIQNKLRVRNRGLSVLIVFLCVAGIITAGILYLIPTIQDEIEKTLSILKLHSGGEGLLHKVLPPHLVHSIERQFDVNRLVRNLSIESLLASGESIWSRAGGLLSSTLSAFSWGLVFVMGLVYLMIFIMIDFEGLARGTINLFPKSGRPIVYGILREVDYYMNSYFRGQALIALSVGILLSIGFSIIGLPLAIILGIFIGLLNFIPYMQALGIIPLGLAAVLMAIQTNSSVWVSLSLAYGVLMIVQVIQDMILVPKIMGGRMGMRPSLILLALSVWGYLLGFFGMLIALPGTMALYSIYMRYVVEDKSYIDRMDKLIEQSSDYLDQEPKNDTKA